MRYAAEKSAYQKHWPEAIAVYMQGLNTPGVLADPDGKRPGWQRTAGDQSDRALNLFDKVLATLKEDYRVDEKRIYATGHSNGSAFTYLFWAARGDIFAAVAPCAAAAGQRPKDFRPKPVLHLAGKKDPLVLFAWQQRTMDAVRKLNGCETGKPWGPYCTLYPSKTKTPVVTHIHPGGHELPKDAPPVIVRFFKEQSK